MKASERKDAQKTEDLSLNEEDFDPHFIDE